MRWWLFFVCFLPSLKWLFTYFEWWRREGWEIREEMPTVCIIDEVINWWSGFLCQTVPDSGPSHCTWCCLQRLGTRCAAPGSWWGWQTGWRPGAGDTGDAAPCHSRGSTAMGSHCQCHSTWSHRFCRHLLPSERIRKCYMKQPRMTFRWPQKRSDGMRVEHWTIRFIYTGMLWYARIM